MRIARLTYFGGIMALAAGCLFIPRTDLSAQQSAPMKIAPNEIGGVVASANGSEAGVWVIAETTDLPTRYIKEVVTTLAAVI